jgi:hypothetical protein
MQQFIILVLRVYCVMHHVTDKFIELTVKFDFFTYAFWNNHKIGLDGQYCEIFYTPLLMAILSLENNLDILYDLKFNRAKTRIHPLFS